MHATHLDDAEVRDLAVTGASVSICPTTEANLGDGLFALSKGQLRDTQETVRRSLVEGPHRRFRASVGAPLDTRMRIIPREGGATCEVPGSYNFVHDVDINPSGQRCSVMYSRRYEIDALRGWLADHGYETRFEQRSKDARGRDRTAHLLLFRARD